MKRATALAAFPLMVPLLACSRGGESEARAKPTGPPAVSKAKDEIPSSDRKDFYTDRFRFGDMTDSDGIVVRETDKLPPGSKAAISLFLRNAPAGTEVRIIWKDLATDATSGEQVKAIGEKGFVAFSQPRPLPRGNYRLEMFYRFPGQKPWENLGTKGFSVATNG